MQLSLSWGERTAQGTLSESSPADTVTTTTHASPGECPGFGALFGNPITVCNNNKTTSKTAKQQWLLQSAGSKDPTGETSILIISG